MPLMIILYMAKLLDHYANSKPLKPLKDLLTDESC